MAFKDHFSTQAADYVRFRPDYPRALFAWLAGEAPAHRLAWDCATGSGQAARALAEFFRRVHASDASQAQLSRAQPLPGVEYAVATAESSGLAPGSVDLITVAQALHWFDLDQFQAEVGRVLAPAGVVAAWSYNLMHITPAVDEILRGFYEDPLGPYWPPERRHVEDGYAHLPLPGTPIPAPAFAMVARWSLGHLLGYLRTWSASVRCQEVSGEDPVEAITQSLTTAWGEAETREVRWPLTVKAARLD